MDGSGEFDAVFVTRAGAVWITAGLEGCAEPAGNRSLQMIR